MRPREARRALNFRRRNTLASSSSSTVLENSATSLSTAKSSSRLGGPSHISPDTATLVSSTSPTPPPFRADRVHLLLNLCHRHPRELRRLQLVRRLQQLPSRPPTKRLPNHRLDSGRSKHPLAPRFFSQLVRQFNGNSRHDSLPQHTRRPSSCTLRPDHRNEPSTIARSLTPGGVGDERRSPVSPAPGARLRLRQDQGSGSGVDPPSSTLERISPSAWSLDCCPVDARAATRRLAEPCLWKRPKRPWTTL